MLEALAPPVERPAAVVDYVAPETVPVVELPVTNEPVNDVTVEQPRDEPAVSPLDEPDAEVASIEKSGRVAPEWVAKLRRLRAPEMAPVIGWVKSVGPVAAGSWSALRALVRRGGAAGVSSVRSTSLRSRFGSLQLAASGVAAPVGRGLRIVVARVRVWSASFEQWVLARVASLSRATRTTRVTLAAVAVIVVVAAVAAVARLVLVTPPSSFTSYAFAPASYQSVLVTNRTWTLTGHRGDQLMGNVILVNSTSGPISGAYDEVIPKSVAGADTDITFVPEPARIVESDPVVEYHYDLAPGESVSLSYSADIGPTSGSPEARLATLAADQVKAQSSYLSQSGIAAPATLAQLSVRPQSMTLMVGQSAAATLSGVMSDGSVASSAVLNGVKWTSADSAVAAIDDSVVSAIGTGSTTLTAQAGDLRTTIGVTVVAPSSSVAATEIQTTPGAVTKTTPRSSSPARSTTAGNTGHQPPPPASSATSPAGPTTTPNTPTDSPTSPTDSPTSPTDSPTTPTDPGSTTSSPPGLLDPVLGLLGL
jgi:hypothetical protein